MTAHDLLMRAGQGDGSAFAQIADGYRNRRSTWPFAPSQASTNIAGRGNMPTRGRRDDRLPTRWVLPTAETNNSERIAIRGALAFGEAVYDRHTTLSMTVAESADLRVTSLTTDSRL